MKDENQHMSPLVRRLSLFILHPSSLTLSCWLNRSPFSTIGRPLFDSETYSGDDQL
jgi:hypothetical protein